MSTTMNDTPKVDQPSDHNPDATIQHGHGIKVDKGITVEKTQEEAYSFWRDFENLPTFMKHVESVTMTGSNTSHWIVKAPAGNKVEWDAEIINDVPNELIAWRSLDDADIPNTGSVRFTPATTSSGTYVHVVLEYDPPAGALGAVVAKIFGEEPSQQVEDDLTRFKHFIEMGQTPEDL